jgi:hypothetical protein
VFVVIGFLAVRAYFRRREADGGGEVEPHDGAGLHAGFRRSSRT